jgi:hypothetical protein
MVLGVEGSVGRRMPMVPLDNGGLGRLRDFSARLLSLQRDFTLDLKRVTLNLT